MQNHLLSWNIYVLIYKSVTKLCYLQPTYWLGTKGAYHGSRRWNSINKPRSYRWLPSSSAYLHGYRNQVRSLPTQVPSCYRKITLGAVKENKLCSNPCHKYNLQILSADCFTDREADMVRVSLIQTNYKSWIPCSQQSSRPFWYHADHVKSV